MTGEGMSLRFRMYYVHARQHETKKVYSTINKVKTSRHVLTLAVGSTESSSGMLLLLCNWAGGV
jgi:hypothetical protein